MVNNILITTKNGKDKLLEIKGLGEKELHVTKSNFMRIYLDGKEYFAPDDPVEKWPACLDAIKQTAITLGGIVGNKY